jgi:hypothetical protein
LGYTAYVEEVEKRIKSLPLPGFEPEAIIIPGETFKPI